LNKGAFFTEFTQLQLATKLMLPRPVLINIDWPPLINLNRSYGWLKP